MSAPLSIGVAGCGPAGMAAALLLARDGHAVTIFERFEAPRPLGSGLMLQPTGMAVLEALGLAEGLKAAAAPVGRLLGRVGRKGMAADGPVVLDVRYRSLGQDLNGWGVHRAALFDLLHRAVEQAGIPLKTHATVTGSRSTADGRLLTFEDGSQAGPFALVVDALGLSSTLAPPTGRRLAYGALWASLDWPHGAGFDETALEQRYRAASVMAGVLPIGRTPGRDNPQAAFFWSLRADRLDAWRQAGLGPWKDEVLALWPTTRPLLDQIGDPAQLTFARYAHRTLRTPVAPGLAQIGDAWHSASPQLGQGANMALLDAYALSLALRDTGDLPSALARYHRLRRGHVGLYQLLTAVLTPVYQSDSRVIPFIRDRLVGPLSKVWPVGLIQAALVAGLVGAPLGPLGLRR